MTKQLTPKSLLTGAAAVILVLPSFLAEAQGRLIDPKLERGGGGQGAYGYAGPE